MGHDMRRMILKLTSGFRRIPAGKWPGNFRPPHIGLLPGTSELGSVLNPKIFVLWAFDSQFQQQKTEHWVTMDNPMSHWILRKRENVVVRVAWDFVASLAIQLGIISKRDVLDLGQKTYVSSVAER
ncbi:hypothetical protein BDFG_03042 [Blastomyces dermatitidis ATCC 26199]|nr:hypothetical protein BDFG_03042 [Blastomyces dermatitidis ATCC 26199]